MLQRLAQSTQGLCETMICQRCAKDKAGVNTCTPSDFIKRMEQQIDANVARIAELENALEVLRNHVQDDYDRIYISAVLAK